MKKKSVKQNNKNLYISTHISYRFHSKFNDGTSHKLFNFSGVPTSPIYRLTIPVLLNHYYAALLCIA